MGGSVTLFSMFYITLIGYWFGPGAGLMTAIAYGLLQLFVDPYIISFPQMLIDYLCGLQRRLPRRRGGHDTHPAGHPGRAQRPRLCQGTCAELIL